MTLDPTGIRVRLRDVTPADADWLEATLRRQRTDGGFNDFGLGPKPLDRDAIATGSLRGEHGGTLVVERVADGQPVGTLDWHLVRYGPNPESNAWMFGIELVPEARGAGMGTEAQRLIADYLFETTSVNRVEASTDVENLAEQRSLEKAGFTREGINRGAQFRAGRYHDLVLYAKLRSDPR